MTKYYIILLIALVAVALAAENIEYCIGLCLFSVPSTAAMLLLDKAHEKK